MKYKVGDIVEIVKEEYAHQFGIGDHVTIIDIDDDGSYECEGRDNEPSWFVTDEEIKLVKTKTK